MISEDLRSVIRTADLVFSDIVDARAGSFERGAWMAMMRNLRDITLRVEEMEARIVPPQARFMPAIVAGDNIGATRVVERPYTPEGAA